ncbi:MAG: hypothetical protein ACI9WU_003208 [Myxococcota bacterium]
MKRALCIVDQGRMATYRDCATSFTPDSGRRLAAGEARTAVVPFCTVAQTSIRWLSVIFLSLMPGCSTDPGVEPADAESTPPTSSARIVDISASAGLGDVGPGEGLSLIDFDDDGIDDVLAPGEDRLLLFRGLGDGRFQAAGSWAHPDETGRYAYTLDVTGDGRRDVVLIGNVRSVALSIDPQGVISELPGMLPGREPGVYASVATVGDWDSDGDLDIYLCRESDSESNQAGSAGAVGAADRFLRREGPVFVDGTAAAGLGSDLASLAALAVDIDQDGNLDLIVGAHAGDDEVWLGDGAGGFVESAASLGMTVNTAAMGYAVGDVNGDQRLDYVVSDNASHGHTLYLAGEDGAFTHASAASGLSASSGFAGWGSALLDFDRDGDLDLFVAHGFPCNGCEGGAQENHLLLNDGAGHFALAEGPNESGLYVLANSRGAVFPDIDGDGDPDILVRNMDGPPTVLRNDLNPDGHWLAVRLAGDVLQPSIGTRVVLEVGAKRYVRVVAGTTGWAASHTGSLHFGLSGAQPVDAITVVWPDGVQESFPGGAVDRHLTLTRSTPRAGANITPAAPPDCPTLCERLSACDLLGAQGLTTTAECVDQCGQETVDPWLALCVITLPCAEAPACMIDAD